MIDTYRARSPAQDRAALQTGDGAAGRRSPVARTERDEAFHEESLRAPLSRRCATLVDPARDGPVRMGVRSLLSATWVCAA